MYKKLEKATVRLAREAAIVEVCNKCGLAGKYEMTEAVREYLTALFECDDRSSVWYSKDFEQLAKKYLKTHDN